MKKLLVSTVFLLAATQAYATFALANSKPKNKNQTNPAAAQERRDAQKIQSEKQDVAKAQDRIQDDYKDLRAAEAAVEKTLAAVGEARNVFETAKDRLKQRLAQQLGLTAALTAQAAAQAAFNDAAQPILIALKQQSDYQEAAIRAKDAEERLSQLAKDQTLASSQRMLLVEAAQAEIKNLKAMEQRAIDSNPAVRLLADKKDAAIQRLANIRSDIHAALEKSPEVAAAEKKWVQAKAVHEKASEHVDDLRRKLAADQAKLNSEKMQLQRANIQDKSNDKSRSNNNKNKKR